MQKNRPKQISTTIRHVFSSGAESVIIIWVRYKWLNFLFALKFLSLRKTSFTIKHIDLLINWTTTNRTHWIATKKKKWYFRSNRRRKTQPEFLIILVDFSNDTLNSVNWTSHRYIAISVQLAKNKRNSPVNNNTTGRYQIELFFIKLLQTSILTIGYSN